MKVQLGYNMHTFLLILLFVVAVNAVDNYYDNNYTIMGHDGEYTYNAITGMATTSSKVAAVRQLSPAQIRQNEMRAMRTVAERCSRARTNDNICDDTGRYCPSSPNRRYSVSQCMECVQGVGISPSFNGCAAHRKAGDFNENGCVDFRDYRLYYNAARRNRYNPKFDLNLDGKLDTGDQFLFAEQYWQGCSGAPPDLTAEIQRLTS